MKVSANDLYRSHGNSTEYVWIFMLSAEVEACGLSAENFASVKLLPLFKHMRFEEIKLKYFDVCQYKFWSCCDTHKLYLNIKRGLLRMKTLGKLKISNLTKAPVLR